SLRANRRQLRRRPRSRPSVGHGPVADQRVLTVYRPLREPLHGTGGSRSMSDVKKVLEGWQKEDVGFVRFELPDMHGISRSKTIPIAHAFDYAERGLNMYGGASVLDTRSDVVPGTLYHDKKGYGDQLLFPDQASSAVIPWLVRPAGLIDAAQRSEGGAARAPPPAC